MSVLHTITLLVIFGLGNLNGYNTDPIITGKVKEHRMRQSRKGGSGGQAPVPRYYKLQMDLLKGIEEGKWAPGEAIPPERKMAEEFGVSIGTVNRAIMNLVSDGYLYRVQGKGTFVSGTFIHSKHVRYTRLREDFKGPDPSFKVKVLELKLVEGRRPVNKNLRLRVDQKLFSLKRLFFNKSGPLMLNISYLPQKMFKGFEEMPRVYLEKMTLYESIEKRYGLPTIFNQELFSIELADEETAEILEVSPGRPLLKIEMLSFTYKEKPYEYRITYCNVDDRKMYREM